MARVIVGLNKIGLEIYLCKHVIQGHAHLSQLRLTWGLTEYFLLTLLSVDMQLLCSYKDAPVKRHL